MAARRKPVPTSGPANLLARQGEFTVAQAAERIGRSPFTLRRWIRQGKIEPRKIQCGSQQVSVFNAQDLKDLQAFSKTIPVGRPPVGLAPMRGKKK